ncbi:MAG TPA: TerB family tellurite resistance protein [Polyangiaceae bacterium]|jgi:tellurite resistance protein|nr:TerB family tellurite resistance protein [Polyangiaceae bacterium]
MADTIRVTASLRIQSAPSRVREQYRDIDHHIRNNVHPSIHYEWEPSASGERKIRTTFRILGVPQFDVSLLEDAPDGSFVIRYLEGTNAGMVLVHRFVEVEPNVTEVQLAADAPATLGRKILGPLFVIGARQVMKKALAEDKRDLEQGEFVPGLAAGNVEAALASLAPYEQAEPAVKRAILEAACLISACDGTVDDAERDAIRRAAAVLGASGAETEPTKLLERCAKLAEGEQIKAEIDRVGAELRAADVAHAGVTAAAVIALVSQGMSLGELAALRRLANAAGLPEEKLEPLIANADSELDAS